MNEHAFWKSCEETQFSSKYYLKTLLGVGGFGAVFKADEVVADRPIRTVAIKIFNSFQTPNLDAFIQEFQTTANLRHPHIIETYVLEEGKLKGAIDALGLVMELAKEDLAKRLERSSFTIEEAKVAVRHVAEALKFLHSKGIIHRDIKPQNIMAVGSGSNLTWKVEDLGIVRER
ncbi:MAG: protein kinase domain-containing protein [Prochlorotrichaceae cyanobacterium]|jgi:serine/threonine protein kinase